MWSNCIQVSILTNNLQFVHMAISSPNNPTQLLFIAIYGSPHPQFRRFLWDDLASVAPCPAHPWLLAGDFNVILSSDERRGGSPRNTNGCKLFRSFIHNHDLIDLGYTGHRFTWRRGTLMERLDRAICNPAFSNHFNNSSVIHLPKVLSDHRPILITLTRHQGARTSGHFKFMASWLSHGDFPNLMAKAWTQEKSLAQNIESFSRMAYQ